MILLFSSPATIAALIISLLPRIQFESRKKDVEVRGDDRTARLDAQVVRMQLHGSGHDRRLSLQLLISPGIRHEGERCECAQRGSRNLFALAEAIERLEQAVGDTDLQQHVQVRIGAIDKTCQEAASTAGQSKILLAGGIDDAPDRASVGCQSPFLIGISGNDLREAMEAAYHEPWRPAAALRSLGE